MVQMEKRLKQTKVKLIEVDPVVFFVVSFIVHLLLEVKLPNLLLF